MVEPFLAVIVAYAFNFAPYGWAFCNGALLSIAQNVGLYSLLGTYFGGDGMNSFGLPDLRGRVPLGMGQGPGLSNYNIAQSGGTETVTLITSQMPAHTHTVTHTLTVAPKASTQAGTTNVPGATVIPAALPTIGAGVNTFAVNGYSNAAADATLLPTDVSGTITPAIAGGSQPHSIMQPYLVLNYCIALQGSYPSRS
ncbi:tail fiber protein [Chitinophaga sp.]|uniref:phage tail protein n=1 Tax=Chitinophaga sp. TaxID=1869181 RepID=UPI0031DC83AE